MKNGVPSPIGWLLLRDGHSVPIRGLSPDDLKAARGATVEREGVTLKHTSGLNAIVHSLGFKGDFGDYKETHWPRIQRLLDRHGLREYRSLFEVADNDLTFQLMRGKRRALADRIFFGPSPRPRRVFTGYGHDWESWDRLYSDLSVPSYWRPQDARFVPKDLELTRRWVYGHRVELFGNLTFFSDHLLDLGSPGRFEAAVYFLNTVTPDEREQELTRRRQVAEAFRWFIDQRQDGWLELIPATENLVLLKGPEGTYDLLWRDLRQTPPPNPETARNPLKLHPQDWPSSLLSEQSFEAWNYYRREAWEEKERHDSERHFYASGGSADIYPGSDVILESFLRTEGVYGRPLAPRDAKVPPGFRRVTLSSGRTLLVSELITIGEFRRFAEETGYLERREGESWGAANEEGLDSAPVGATLLDALAYCAWKERALGTRLRLFSLEEHRALRPFASEHYRRLSFQDFPWENWPPRYGLQDSVLWSEPRFLAPGPDLPEFPVHGVGTRSRKRWIDAANWPPRARWCDPLPWAEHAGLRFIDAWDAYEWCSEGQIAGRYWQGMIGTKSWGEYKNIKVGFRLVFDLDPADE